MVSNQRKAFLDMLAWSENDNGHQKTRNHGYDVIVGGRLLYVLRSPRKLVTLNPKTQINRRGRRSFFPVEDLGCLPQAAWPERLLSVRTLWHCSRLRSVALYLWLIVVSPSTINGWQYLGFTAGRWLWSDWYWYNSLIAKFKEAGGTVREIDAMSRVTAIISALVICIIVCLSWAVNHYRDNAITYKAQRDKNARELESWRTRQLLTCRCVSVMLLRSMQNTRRVSWC